MGRPRYPGPLTPAELRVLAEVRLGLTNAEIAVRLGLSPDTVKSHVASMLSKLDLEDRRELAVWREDEGRRRSWWWLPAPGKRTKQLAVGAFAGGVLLVLVALLLAARRAEPVPVTSQDGSSHRLHTGTILFVGTPHGDLDGGVYGLDTASGASRVLAQVPGEAAFVPSWAPGEERFSFLTAPVTGLPAGPRPLGSGSIWVAEASGADLRMVTGDVAIEPLEGGLPVNGWLANGTGVIFSLRESDGYGFELLAAGQRPGTIDAIDGPSMLGCPMGSQSPDGQFLVCVAPRGPLSDGVVSINRVDRDSSSGGYQIRDAADPRQPSVSADGKWVAWWGMGNGSARVYVAAMTGGDPVFSASGIYPRWSPVGAQLTFVTGFATVTGMLELDGVTTTVRIHDMTTGVTRILANDGRPRWPAWSPQGDAVAFVADASDGRPEVFIAALDGAGLQRVTDNDLDEAMLDWSPPPSTAGLEPSRRIASVKEVLASGEPVPYAVCLTGESWKPLTTEQQQDLLARPDLGDGRGGVPAWSRRLVRSRFHYVPQVATPSNWSGIEESVFQYLLGGATRDTPSCDYETVSTPPVVTRGVIVLGHRVIAMRRLGETLVVVVESAPGHWEEAVVPYPADVSIPYQRYYFSVVAFVDAEGRVREELRADRGW